MTDLRALKASLEEVKASAGELRQTIEVFGTETASIAENVADEAGAIELPEFSLDLDELDGLTGLITELGRLTGLPEVFREERDSLAQQVAELEIAAASFSEVTDALSETVETQTESWVEVVTDTEDHLSEVESAISDAGAELGDGFEELLETRVKQAAHELLESLVNVIDDLMETALDAGESGANAVGEKVSDVQEEFKELCEGLIRDQIEEAARKIVSEVLEDVVMDLGLDQAVSQVCLQLNTTLATMAPNVGPAIKAVSTVKKLLAGGL
ncbi:hypothetical protein [Roseibium album]|uniref:Phage-related protein n=1 Tax=Roseibium album TaxID=311410 RepID=A0A0M6Z7S0_9HYPH|nr:hypothetical protein [Roseibium album]CTQ58467.1 Phage-related protein [Roseibium album]CTQ66546.1 Phage-related protein [Roseibium album]CTQ71647.1 Phage-related protein [Roseibium album]